MSANRNAVSGLSKDELLDILDDIDNEREQKAPVWIQLSNSTLCASFVKQIFADKKM